MSSHLPEPSHYPSYRKASEKENPTFRGEAHRTRSALSFAHGADTYHDVRPSYPGEVAELIADAHTVLDVGAGTGKLTETLTNLQVLACDPSPDMTRVLREQLGFLRGVRWQRALRLATPPWMPLPVHRPGIGWTSPRHAVNSIA